MSNAQLNVDIANIILNITTIIAIVLHHVWEMRTTAERTDARNKDGQ